MTGGARGATLVELLVAVALVGLALGAVATVSLPVLAGFEADPAAADAQQRVRSATQTLASDLQRAGSGYVQVPEAGPGLGLPALLPAPAATGAWSVLPQAATVTTWYAPRGPAHAAVRDNLPAGALVVPLIRPVFCGGAPQCGFSRDDEVLLYLPHGRFTLATIREVNAPLDLVLSAPLREAWPAGTMVSVTVVHTYELREDAATGLSQIVRRLGAGPATPVIDFVRTFEVEWFAGVDAPRVRNAPDGTEEHATSGPLPPTPGVVADPAWPPGENCAYLRDGAGQAMWRGAAGAAAPAAVPTAVFADGPWCPSDAAPVRWDLDLARVTHVRLAISVAAAVTALRPPLGLGLTRPMARLVPDLALETVVRPGRFGGGGR